MEVTVSGRMGDPEVGAVVHAKLVTLRKELKSAFANLQVPEVVALDLTVFFSGTISAYCEKGGISAVKYRKAKKELAISLCFVRSEILDVPPRKMLSNMRSRFLECADAIPAVLSKHSTRVDRDALSSTIETAFRHLDLD